ncbi:MAG: thiolase family protein [Deltaproteobacteria bacterium]|nr:thiolase family protein [Deltaproteobacteria bacterium]MBW2044744.1 thiolase family protein [Deltaproteobacteria bacterium]MBW2301707.1 thiolase family protein [Deltaproteobacteria bacterium]
MNRDVFIVAAQRTPIGDFGGGFKSLNAIDLIVPLMRTTIGRSGLPIDRVGKVILGNTLAPLNPNIARAAAIACGIPPETPSFTIHCACASAMQALISGISAITLGETETALVGGVESMTNAPYILSSNRWGQRLRHAQATDLLWWGMQEDPIMGGQGRSADYLAKKYNISREEQDELAALSHERALTAQSEGYFDNEIVPIEVKERNKAKVIQKDEHPREDATLENLRRLPAVFSDEGTVTAGNASAINDGAAAIVLATEEACEEYGMKPIAKPGVWSIKAADPKLTGIAPVPAIKEVLDLSGLSLSDLKLIEINEAFAAYYLACEKELGLERKRANVNGSGISLGHPVGATGSRIVVTLIHEMIRQDVAVGLASLCAGGGMGYAILIRRDLL